MSWIPNEWYECTVKTFDYVESPVKKTKAFEMQCHHPEHGTVTGQWWLTDSIDSKTGKPQWMLAKGRCIKLGCVDEELNGPGWIDHAKKIIVGQTVACLVAYEEYQDKDGHQQEKAVAKFIGIPSGSAGGARSGYQKADVSVSPFAGRSAGSSALDTEISDDDLPF